MTPIRVFEHEAIHEPLSAGEKTALDRLRGARGEKMFEVGWREVKAASFVGVVRLGARTVQVLPKMHKTDLAAVDCERQATANLLFLLSYTGHLRVTEPEISRLTEQGMPLSETLYWIFARRLWDAVRRELLRGYVNVEERSGVLKGRWHLAAQVRRSDGWRRERFDVAYDEYTEDNLPNRLLCATVLQLSRWATRSDTRSLLAQLRSAFTDVAGISPQRRDFIEAVRWMQRYRRRAGDGRLYRPLLEMARMFWTGGAPQPSPGRIETFAFMFDMNQLFEGFITQFVRRELRDVCQAHASFPASVWPSNPAGLRSAI